MTLYDLRLLIERNVTVMDLLALFVFALLFVCLVEHLRNGK